MIRPLPRLLAALPLALLLACGDDKPAPTPTPEPSAAPAAQAQPSQAPIARAQPKPKPTPAPVAAAASASASSSAAAEPPPAPAPEPTVDCDALLTPEDILAMCNAGTSPDTGGIGAQAGSAAPTPESVDIGEERSCSRRFTSKAKGAISFVVIRHGTPEEARERFLSTAQEVSSLADFKAVDKIGDSARRYVKKTAVSGDPMYTVEAVKGRFEVQIFNPKITVGAEAVGPVCSLDQLQRLLAIELGRLP